MKSGKRVGLARALSKLGYCSRSQAGALIAEGRVTLNGRVVRDPETPVRLEADKVRDKISVDGALVEETPFLYLVLNKPRGIVTTAEDEKGRATVYDLLPDQQSWVGPVGRLDKASEGLLLLTNDSEWAAAITDPASHLPKIYHVQIDRLADDGLLNAIVHGVRDDEDRLRAASAHVIRAGEKNCWLEIVLTEGKNRHIRRLLQALDIEVLRLIRIAIGPLLLGDLKKGEVRPLSASEKSALDQALGRKSAPKNNRRMPIDVG